jgi:RNA polymerase sigma-19 factor, ECF subfamily
MDAAARPFTVSDPVRAVDGAADTPRLVARLRAGDERALEHLFLAYAGRMHRVAYRHLRSSWAARAVVQDVFTSLWERHATIAVQGSLGAYLTGAVRKRALSVLREELRRRERDGRWVHLAGANVTAHGTAEAIAPAADGASLGEGQGIRVAVERALAELPARQQAVFRLRVERQLTNAEVRDVMGAVSVKAVELLYSRAVKALRVRLLPQLAELEGSLGVGQRRDGS